MQRYLCQSCKRSFVSNRRSHHKRISLWRDFVFNRYTVKQLAAKYDRSTDWVRKQRRLHEPPVHIPDPRPIVAVMDCVFFGRTKGYMVVRDPHGKENVYWSEIGRESLAEYECATDTLESLGYEVLAIVVDGKRGLTRRYASLPVQMCHFHQAATVRRYLTMRPRVMAGIELKEIAQKLGHCSEESLASELAAWHDKWRKFLAEKSTNPDTGKGHYTHRRLRSAYFSLKRNLPYLYAYQRHPELHIPNTTNGLESSFSYLKDLVRVHRGIKDDLKDKMINFILQNRPTKT